jgi:hypothetical protein
MVLMVQLRDQRIAGKDHGSEAVHDNIRDLTGSHRLYVYFEGRSGSLFRPLFANHRSAFAFVLSKNLTSAMFGSFIWNESESKTWQMLGVVWQCQKIRKNPGGWKEL